MSWIELVFCEKRLINSSLTINLPIIRKINISKETHCFNHLWYAFFSCKHLDWLINTCIDIKWQGIIYRLDWRTIYVLMRSLFWCLIKVNTKRILKQVHEQLVMVINTLFNFLHDICICKWWLKRHSTCVHFVSDSFCLCSADVITVNHTGTYLMSKFWCEHVKSDIQHVRYQFVSWDLITANHVRSLTIGFALFLPPK